MPHVVIATHGGLAEGLRNAAQMIVGDRQDLIALGLMPGDSMEDFRDRMRSAVEAARQDGVLILTDLRGATPFNTAAALAGPAPGRARVLSGVNLAMVIEALSHHRAVELSEAAQRVLLAGQAGIVDFHEALQRQARRPAPDRNNEGGKHG